MDKRMKAQDVFMSKDHWLSKPVGFAEAFPTVEKLSVEVEERDWMSPVGYPRHYSEHSAAEYVNCSNRKCFNGGFHLGQTLRFMVDAGETTKEDTYHCQGYEGSPKGAMRIFMLKTE